MAVKKDEMEKQLINIYQKNYSPGGGGVCYANYYCIWISSRGMYCNWPANKMTSSLVYANVDLIRISPTLPTCLPSKLQALRP